MQPRGVDWYGTFNLQLFPPVPYFEISERAANAMAIMLYGTDAVCMAMLAVCADKWEGTSTAKGIDTAVVIIQLVVFLGEWPRIDGDLVRRSVEISGEWPVSYEHIK